MVDKCKSIDSILSQLFRNRNIDSNYSIKYSPTILPYNYSNHSNNQKYSNYSNIAAYNYFAIISIDGNQNIFFDRRDQSI